MNNNEYKEQLRKAHDINAFLMQRCVVLHAMHRIHARQIQSALDEFKNAGNQRWVDLDKVTNILKQILEDIDGIPSES